MVTYQCPRCHYRTVKKHNLLKHYNRKNVCERKFSKKSIDECKNENTVTSENQIIIDMQNEIELLKMNQIEFLKRKQCSINNIICRDQINNNTINININDFKDTNYEIALEDLKSSIRQSLLKNDGECNNIECNQLVELVHCNDKYPENQNVLITDCSRGEARVKDGNHFKKVPMVDAIDDIVSNIINLLKNNNVFSKYVKIYERNYKDDSIKEIRDTLYNNRQKIKDTAKGNNLKVI